MNSYSVKRGMQWVQWARLLAALGICLAAIPPAQAASALCKPIESATFANRVHVRCEQAVLPGGLTYFAVSTVDPRFASRALSVMEAAQVSDKVVRVTFEPGDSTGPSFDCALADCRPLSAIVLVEDLPPPRPLRCQLDPTDVGCPAYCRANDDMNCPGYCTRHATDPDCAKDPVERCDKYPRSPGCNDARK